MASRVNLTKEELLKEIFDYPRPDYIRKGQHVFNYIDRKYKVARYVQFLDNVDCFYNDSNIDMFIDCAIKRINEGQ